MKPSTEKDHLHHDISGENILEKNNETFSRYRRLWDENPRNLQTGSFPLHLDIEVTSHCNLKCPFCATTYSQFEDGFMKWSTAKKIIDEAGKEGLFACKFNFRGEPLLHKEIGKFIKYAKEAGIIDVYFNTNAVLLNDEKALMLIDSGLDRLTISFEGFSKEIYEKSRVGAKFEQVVKNVKQLRKLREKVGSSTPKIRVQAVLIPEIKDKLGEFVSFWKDTADQVSYNDMEPAVNAVKKKIQFIQSDWICPFPYQRLTIMWDGTITACKNDYFGKLSMGNVNEISIKEIWNSSLTKLRQIHLNGNAHKVDACAECPLRMSELLKRGECQ